MHEKQPSFGTARIIQTNEVRISLELDSRHLDQANMGQNDMTGIVCI